MFLMGLDSSFHFQLFGNSMDLGKVPGIKIHSGIPSPSFCGPQKWSKKLKFVVAGKHENCHKYASAYIIHYKFWHWVNAISSVSTYYSISYPPYPVLLCYIVPYNINSTLFRPKYVHIAGIVSYIDFICQYHDIPGSQQKNKPPRICSNSFLLLWRYRAIDLTMSQVTLSFPDRGHRGMSITDRLGKGYGNYVGHGYTPPGKPSHIPPKGIRKIVGSKMPWEWGMLVPGG